MPKFSANISTLFREYPLIERIGRVADAGFDAVEIQFPYGEDPQTLKAELDARRMPLVLMNFPVGDLMRGGEGLAAVPGREADFESALLAYMHAEHGEMMSNIVQTGDYSDEIEATFKSAIETFKSTQTW